MINRTENRRDADEGKVGATARSSPVLTLSEAASWLRLDDGVTTESGKRYVTDLVTAGRLRALGYGARRLFRLSDLERFVDEDSGASDSRSGARE